MNYQVILTTKKKAACQNHLEIISLININFEDRQSEGEHRSKQIIKGSKLYKDQLGRERPKICVNLCGSCGGTVAAAEDLLQRKGKIRGCFKNSTSSVLQNCQNHADFESKGPTVVYSFCYF